MSEFLFAEDIKKKDLRVDEPTPILFPANPGIQVSVSCHIMTIFFDNFEELAILDIIDAANGICGEVKKVIYEITDSNCTLSVAELSSLAQRYQNYLGGEYLVVYSNIFKSSSEYWHPVSTRSSNSRKVIAADCVGGLLGLTCCGAMSVIWGAAFSYSLDKCLEPYTVTIQPDDPIYKDSNDSVVWTANINGNN